MKVLVKLFSILRDYVPDYNPEKGVEAQLPEGSTVGELLNLLGIPMSAMPVITCDGHFLKPTDTIHAGSALNIFQPVAGG